MYCLSQSPCMRAFSSQKHYPAHLIVNAVGADRPGIVAEITKYVTDAGGNVGASQAAKLGHYFSLMMQVSVPTGALDRLRSSLTEMQNMNASIFETDAPDSITVAPTIGCKFFGSQAVHFDCIHVLF